MPRVIHFEKARQKIRDNKPHRYNAYSAFVDFVYQKKYKINSELSDLYVKYLGEHRSWIEFKEALPKLESELLHYSVVHYYFAWHRCKRQLFDTLMFQKLGFYYQFRYSKEKCKKIFYYICYPRIIKSGDRIEQYKLFDLKKEIKFNFTAPKKDWSIYGGWVNPFEPINKGRLGSTQEWRVEKPKKHYY